jgi:hypothetical protein
MLRGTELFFLELGANPELAEHAKPFADAIEALDREGDGNASAAGLFHVVHWVLCHRAHNAYEKIEMVHKLLQLRGRQVGTPREITGWR